MFLKSENSGSSAVVEMKKEGDLTGVKVKFAVEYLKKIMNTKLSKKIQLFLKNDFPLTLVYKNDNLEMKYILAPRVENN